MDAHWKACARSLTAVLLAALLAIPSDVYAQAAQHLVSPSDLTTAAVDASQQRQQHIDTLDQFFASPEAQRALESAHMSPQQVTKAVSGLSDDELAQLSTRAGKAQADFAAGNMTDHDLIIILICIAALVLIIVAVDH